MCTASKIRLLSWSSQKHHSCNTYCIDDYSAPPLVWEGGRVGGQQMQCHLLDDGAARDLRYVLISLRCKVHCFAIPQMLILVFFISYKLPIANMVENLMWRFHWLINTAKLKDHLLYNGEFLRCSIFASLMVFCRSNARNHDHVQLCLFHGSNFWTTKIGSLKYFPLCRITLHATCLVALSQPNPQIITYNNITHDCIQISNDSKPISWSCLGHELINLNNCTLEVPWVQYILST